MRSHARLASRFLLWMLLLIHPALGIAADESNPKPVEVIGPVQIGNLPGVQSVTGTVAVNNFPQVQNVTGAVTVGNLPQVQQVSGSVGITNLPQVQNVTGAVTVGNLPQVQQVSGSVGITNLPSQQHVIIDQFTPSTPLEIFGGVSVVNQPSVTLQGVASGVKVDTYVLGGKVTVENSQNLDRGGQDVISLQAEGSFWVITVPENRVVTDLIVYSATETRTCLIEMGEQSGNAVATFFSFEAQQGLNKINLNSGIESSAGHPLGIKISRQHDACGASLLWTGRVSGS